MASEGGCVKEENALDYGKFQVKLAELLDRSTIRRLTFYFEFSLAERDKISNNEDPGLELLDQLEAKGLMSSRDVSKVICALKEIDRSGVAEKVERMLNVTQPSKQEPKHEKSDESHVGKTRKARVSRRTNDKDEKAPPELKKAPPELKKAPPELKKAPPELTRNDSAPSVTPDVYVSVTNKAESIIDLKVMKDLMGARLIVIDNERLAITSSGLPSEDHSFIVIINMDGKPLRLDRIPKEKGSARPASISCSLLYANKIALLLGSGQIGMYDVHKGRVSDMKSLGNLMDGWSENRFLSSITTDIRSKDIFLGSHTSDQTCCRELLIFDKQLQYRHVVRMPDGIHAIWDMVSYGSNLLVCDAKGKKAMSIDLQGKRAKVVYEFEKPSHRSSKLRPISICRDNNKLIYILWWTSDKQQEDMRLLTQYSQDGGKLLKTITFGDNACAIATTDTKQGEKLLVLTVDRKLYKFGLLEARKFRPEL